MTEARTSHGWMWASATVVVTVLVASARMLVTPGFYFADDTQLGSIGLWFELGDRLLKGGLPVLSPQAWQAGNYFAEGQWGLINPVSLTIALGMRLASDAVLYVSVVKIAFLALMALGVYLLARSFRARPSWAAVAGVLAPLAGFTVYMDAPSWVTGLFNAAVFPWVWWSLRRALGGRSPIPFLIASYVLVTFGYVFGVIVLVVLLVDALIRQIARRDRSGIWRASLASAWAGLWTIVVYLPGVLTGPVTTRAGLVISNSGFLNADLSDLGAMSTPTATASIGSWGGPVTPGPLVYIAWILPLVLLCAPFARSAWRGLATPLVLAGVMTVLLLGPNDIGPIRWPVRFMPYIVIAVVVILAVLATRGYPQGVTRSAVLRAVLAVAALNWLAWVATPPTWLAVGFSVAVQLIVLVVMVVLARPRSWLPTRLRPEPAVAVVMIAVSALYVLPQLKVFPQTPLPVFAVPSDMDGMTQVLQGVEGDVMTVGDPLATSQDTSTFDERLISNLWYLSEASVANLYTVLPFTTFSADLCMELKGRTCETASDTLLSIDLDTGERVADLLSVSHIIGFTATVPEPPQALPDGWHLESESALQWQVSRDEIVPAAGGVTWTGSGTDVTVVSRSETSVTLEVDAIGADARVAFSRLAWPGYSVSGATMTDPVRDYLLTVDVSSAEPGDIVTVTFRPPGFPVELAAATLAGVVLVFWMTVRWRVRRRTGASGNVDQVGVPSVS